MIPADWFDNSGLAELRRWLIDRQLPVLSERSVRLQPGMFEPRRALFSVPTAAIEELSSVDEVLQICRAMSSPIAHLTAIRRYFRSAAFVHFGFEYSVSTAIGKCYLELSSSVPATSADDGRLMFLGFKWSMNDTSLAVVSRYRNVHPQGPSSLTECFLNEAPEELRPELSQLAQRLEPECETDKAEMRLLEVTEEGSDRRSFDLNVYAAQQPVALITDLVHVIAERFTCADNEVNEWLHKTAAATVGHISAGRTRSDQPFLTIYYQGAG
ncbi:MAG: hypothetical protein R3C49_19375 [Planctomycetaceae bacterium]